LSKNPKPYDKTYKSFFGNHAVTRLNPYRSLISQLKCPKSLPPSVYPPEYFHIFYNYNIYYGNQFFKFNPLNHPVNRVGLSFATWASARGRHASEKTPEEITKDLRINIKDVQKVLAQLGGEPSNNKAVTPEMRKEINISPRYHLIAISAICLLSILIYSNTFNSTFVFDDKFQIEENLEIRDLDNYFSIKQLLKPRAIVDFTFALNYKFGKLNVFGYHLVNVLIHILNGLLVYFLSLTIFRQLFTFRSISNSPIPQSPNSSIPLISLLTALIFAVHPIPTQAVTYTIQRYASMAAMFYMASVLFYLKARVMAQSSPVKQTTHRAFSL